MGRRSFTKRDLLIGLAGFVFGLFCLLLWLSPRAITPESQHEKTSATDPLVITFNRPLDPDNLPDHFSISPEVIGTLEVAGRQIIFYPDRPFEYGSAVTVSLRAGFRGSNGLPALVKASFTFEIEDPRILFLRDFDGRSNIWRQETSGELSQLTDEPVGVWDFQVVPDGRGILYASLKLGGTSDLLLLTNDGRREILLECPADRCIGGQWQPGGTLVAFERIPVNSDNDLAGEVWLLNSNNGELEPAVKTRFFDESVLYGHGTHSPRWSVEGRHLSFFHPDSRVVIVLDLAEESFKLVPANLEIMGDWSPTAFQLAYSELAFGEESPDPGEVAEEGLTGSAIPSLYNHITVVDMATEVATDLTIGEEMDYGRPAWHPDGESLVLPAGTRGAARQIWTLSEEGGERTVLTHNPTMNHSALAWSPDGRWLAFMGNDRGDDSSVPAVWLLEAETGMVEIVLEGAYLPAWQP